MTTTATKHVAFSLRAWREPDPGAAWTLAFFRLGFGLLMCLSLLRFAGKGWIYELYVLPKVYFPFYGFEWVKPLPEPLMYAAFGLLVLFSLGIALGFYYRFSAVAFFLLFTYVELIDKTNYLNHYYFISLAAFLLIFLPAHAVASFDARAGRVRQAVRRYHYLALLLQVGSVYFFAGIAKIKPDWLLHAQPLRIWLQANNDIPLIGPLLEQEITAYLASWAGMLFDISIPFLLLWKRTRVPAYVLVVFFHICTGVLFNIGMFPYIMMFAALVFFPQEQHRRWLQPLRFLWGTQFSLPVPGKAPVLSYLLLPFFLLQILLPFRYLLYPGDPFITEEGFRFSWNVMLMEKNGICEFRVHDPRSGRDHIVYPSEWLSKQQERMMSSQPDMILQFAHMLAEAEKARGNAAPEVYAQCYVAVNGRGSRVLIDPHTNLAAEKESFYHKKWIRSDEP
ncbi:MAG: HTTM domain-containing protein [Bacteroidia bacterium]|nr:HTTM domain-containing protein [Bacteroidia bacterium]